MEYSDAENGSDGELIDDILGPEDLFNDEADEEGGGDDDDDDDDGHRDQDEAEEAPEKPDPEAKEKAEKKVKKSRIVKNPRVTLNINALRGSNGLAALKKMFTNFKFKGSGHEEEDLTRIMEILQQWMCYKLCPSYNFESCMLQLEALGKKKVVQTLMKKYRLGMDEWGETKSDGEDKAMPDDNMEISEQINRNEFDILLDEEIANARSDDELSLHEVPQSQPKVQAEQEITLTQEQLERIARNRKLAEERRMKRMSMQCEAMDVGQDQEISLEQINLEEKS